MFAADAFLLAKLAGCMGAIPGPGCDLSQTSPAFRPLAERLLAASVTERQAIWYEFLARSSEPVASTSNAAAAVEPNLGSVPRAAVRLAKPAESPGLPVTPLPTSQPARPERGVRMTCAGRFEPRAIAWLWADRVPLGMITMFAGDPKLGKSFVTLAMAAAVSRGLPLPQSDQPDRPGSTILMSAEDGPARTIVPRLLAGGADLSRIHVIESVVLANGSEALPSLRVDVDAISAAAARLGDCRLIVIDPISAYLKGVDDNRNALLRGVLSPLKNLAERLGAAVVLVSHLTKAVSSNGKHRVLGSIAYVGACRANFLFVPDPNDPAGRRVLLVDNGGNLAPRAAPLAYTIENQNGSGLQIVWSDEPVTITVEEALRPRAEPPRDEPELTDCEQWLREALVGGRVLVADLRRAGLAAGFAWRTLHRARWRIGARSRREGFGPATKSYWQLREAANQGPPGTTDLPLTP
jgi:hypothetical protein